MKTKHLSLSLSRRYKLFQTRLDLYNTVYYHRVCKAYDFMISDALVAADPVLNMSEECRYLHTLSQTHTPHFPSHTHAHTHTHMLMEMIS